MEKEIVKKAVREAENSLKENQIAEVKKIVLKTLEKINKLDKEIDETKAEIKELEEQRKILRMDLDDMKEGRLDRISERQAIDKKAKEVSVVIIIKEKETIIERDRWHFPYQIIWQQPYVPTYPMQPIVTYSDNSGDFNTTYGITSSASSLSEPIINCSVTKFATVGTYNVDGKVINLR
jgi:TolA-binding protein